MNRNLVRALLAATLASASGLASADLGWSVTAGVANSDNANRVETGKVDDTLATLGASIDYTHESRRLQASLNGSGTYLEYLDDTYDSDFIASGTASLVFGIVPERFLWTIEDTFGQLTINQFEPVTPENRQNANFFSTGPDFFLRLGSQTDLQIGGRYADSRYEETDTVDDTRLTGTIALIRRTSPNVAWSAVADATRVEYDLPGDPGYDQQSLFGRLEAEGARQTLSVDLGATRVKDGDESYTNPLLRLSWNRRLTPSWTMDLSLGSEYRNTADRFVSGVSRPDTGTGAVNASGVPSETYYGGLSFAFERPRTRFYFGGSYNEDNYVRSGELDEENWSANVGASRRFTERLQGFADYRVENRDYSSSIGSDDTQTFSLRLDWALGRVTFVTLGYRREDRDSDIGTNSYTENLVYLSFSYRQGTVTGPGAVAF
jgi:hypothetical protein